MSISAHIIIVIIVVVVLLLLLLIIIIIVTIIIIINGNIATVDCRLLFCTTERKGNTSNLHGKKSETLPLGAFVCETASLLPPLGAKRPVYLGLH